MTDRTRKFLKYLRIAWTAFFAVVTVLLCTLWVRSRNHFDQIGSVMSAQGKLYLAPSVNLFPTDEKGITAETYQHFGGKATTIRVSNVRLIPLAGTGAVLPYWPLVLITPLLTVAPWIRWRFSLRSLLIATTVVAVVLGFVAWTVK